MAFTQGQFPRRERPLPANPRRVRGGVKLKGKEAPDASGWAAQRWLRIVEEALAPDEAQEALEYARLGQTKKVEIEDGVLRAPVQGRQTKPYQVVFEFERFSDGDWDRIVELMADQAVHTAKLLAGELPTSIEDILSPLGLKLFPTAASEVLASTTCKERPAKREDGFEPWSKHMGCVGYLLAERLDKDPFVIFQLRGMPAEELLERIRQKRALAGMGSGAAPVYVPVVPGASDTEPEPLEAQLDRFWNAGPELDLLETPISKPEVSHPLLRRLGPSPFEGSRFPLVGLLATCYDIISEAAIKEAQREEDGLDSDPEDSERLDAESEGSSETEGSDEA